MIAVSILDNSITHAHTYVIVVLCVPVATHRHLPSIDKKNIILGKSITTKHGYLYDILC